MRKKYKTVRPSSKAPADALPSAPVRRDVNWLLEAFKTLFCSGPSLQAGYDRIFSMPVTLWYMVYQRLQADHCLDAVVDDVHDGGADALGNPSRKPLSQRIVSQATTAYSNARQRLALSTILSALGLLVGKTQPRVDCLWHGLRVVLVDGTTFRMRPLGNIPKVFIPHGNQHSKKNKNDYWCLARVVGCFCAHTGLVLDSQLGHLRLSEPALICRIILRQTAQNLLYVGDRAYGIFRIVQTARHAGAGVLVRLTRSRALKMVADKKTKPGSHCVSWVPSRHDRCEPNCSKEPVQGRLLVISLHRNGFRDQILFLFTTLTDPILHTDTQLLELYGRRWQVELNFRYVKSQLELDQSACHSAKMAIKEWYAGLLAYNLIRSVMYEAASIQGISSDTLSFSAIRRLIASALASFGQGRCQRQTLLSDLVRKKLPTRRKRRPNEPRCKRHLRESFPPLRGSRDLARQQLLHASVNS